MQSVGRAFFCPKCGGETTAMRRDDDEIASLRGQRASKVYPIVVRCCAEACGFEWGCV